MRIVFIWRWVAPAVCAAALAACSRGGPAGAERATAEVATRVADVIGALKLLRQEYANAVPPAGGSVADATEYAETELFAEQAAEKFRALASVPGAPVDERRRAIDDGLTRVRADVRALAPPRDVASHATAALTLLEEVLAGAVPEQVRGAVLATARADQAVAAEQVVGEYRIGITTGPARRMFRRDAGGLVAVPSPPDAVYLGVLLRERRTKRPLPAGAVTVRLAGEDGPAIALTEVWGDFHQYGANVVLPPDGPMRLAVQVAPPAYARHGDMLTHFVTPASASFMAHVRGGALAFDALPATPIDADYTVGDDVLQATTEAGSLRDAGPYRVGLILEGPEPIWTWKNGVPVLEPVVTGATNHIEVVLLDRETDQLVPDAHVTLTFRAGGRDTGTAMLHPLLSIFSHYGQTLVLPSGVDTVQVQVDPPALGALDRPRLADGATIELPLPHVRGKTT